MQESTLEQLQQQLQSKNVELRRQAAEQLGYCKDERAVEALIVALSGEERDFGVLYTVATALVEIGDPRAVPALVETLQHHQDDFLRVVAAEILGRIGGVPMLEVLVRVLQEEREVGGVVRAGAVRALGQIGDARAIEPLMSALQDKDWRVQQAAAKALTVLGQKVPRQDQCDKCPSCGAEVVRSGDRFCLNCGTSVGVVGEQTRQLEERNPL